MPQPERVASRQHAIVRRCRRAAARRSGDREILLDGEHLISDAIDAGVAIDVVLTDGRHAALAARARQAGAAVYVGTEAVLAAASPVRTPSGVVALASWMPVAVESVLDADGPLVIGLVSVQDPGNLGSAIRAADALGAAGVLALDDSADPAGWKALRGAMGSAFRIRVGRGRSEAAIAAARARGRRIAAAAGGTTPIDLVDLSGRWLVLLGNEGAGLPAALLQTADERIAIPMRAGVESINVAVTAALFAYHFRNYQQRFRNR